MADTTAPAPGPARYATVAIVLHWVIAALIMLQIVLAGRMEGRSPEAFAIVQLHKSVGITVLLLSLARLAWRLTHRAPPLPAEMPRWEKLAAQAVHVGFYVIMIGAPLTGWTIVSTSRIQIPTLLYGVVPWPHVPGLADLAGAVRESVNEAAEFGHEALVKVFYVLIALHVAGALKHQFVARDEVLGHMAPGARPGRWLEPRLLAVALAAIAVFAFGRTVQPARPAALPTAPAAAPAPAPEATAPPVATAPAETVASPVEAAEATAAAEAVAWKIEPSSSLEFETTWGGAAVKGRFTKWSGDIVFGPDALEKSRVAIRIDMTSAQTGDSQTESALPTDEFFDAANHPTATFTATRFEKVSDERYVARGELDLRGVKKPLALPFRLQIDEDKARVRGVTSLDRTTFGVGQGEWQSTDQIPAKVTVRVDLRASR